jgi:hypothetical protein
LVAWRCRSDRVLLRRHHHQPGLGRKRNDAYGSDPLTVSDRRIVLEQSVPELVPSETTRGIRSSDGESNETSIVKIYHVLTIQLLSVRPPPRVSTMPDTTIPVGAIPLLGPQGWYNHLVGYPQEGEGVGDTGDSRAAMTVVRSNIVGLS